MTELSNIQGRHKFLVSSMTTTQTMKILVDGTEYETLLRFFCRQQVAQKGDDLAKFGPEIGKLMTAVKREKGFRRPPIGPVGSYIKLTQGQDTCANGT